MGPVRTATVVAQSACFVLGLSACSSPTKPSETVASARPVSPPNGAQVPYYRQPVTLLVTNGIATGVTSLTDSFEVATDAVFSDKVVTKDVPQDPNGQTAVVLNPLPSRDYYWRVRT